MYDASGHDAVHALIEEFAGLAPRVHASGDFAESMLRITSTAEQAIGGCEAASISLLMNDGAVTYGATDTRAAAADQIQYEEGEGPCLDAALHRQWIYTPDLQVDPRWPRSAARMASQVGVHSMFSCRMTLESSPDHTLGGLNLYASVADAFPAQDQMLAILLASLGAVVVDAARQQEHLRAAIESRQVIGEAIGILRSQSKLSSEEAFAMLAKASQRTNVKLRDLARQIADGSGTGLEPV